MFFNNLKIAFRTLVKNKTYTTINVVGLMIGIAAVLLIYRMVSYELSFNKSFVNYDRIVRVVGSDPGDVSEENRSVCTPVAAMRAIRTDIPQFEKVARIRETWNTLTVPGETEGIPKRKFSVGQSDIAFFVDPEFDDIFKLTWLSGNNVAALAQPSNIMLSRSWAEKLFDNWEDATGKVVKLDNFIPLTVQGVFEDLSNNTDFPLTFLVSYPTLELKQYRGYLGLSPDDSWGGCTTYNQIFALLKDKNQTDAANAVLANVGKDHYRPEPNGKRRVHQIQPFSMLHFDTELGSSAGDGTSYNFIKILIFIGILILLIASFNFINLATSQATQRAKEVGVRKTLGGRPAQLMAQFMSETALIVGISIILGMVLSEFALPLLQYVSDVPLHQPFLTEPNIWGLLLTVFVVITLLAGLYPAFVLSSYRPVEALTKNIKTRSLGGMNLQRSLVVAQFVISSILIISAVITIKQLDYIQEQDLGFKENLVYTFSINSDSLSLSKHTVLKNKLSAVSGITEVSLNSDQPMSYNTWIGSFQIEGRSENEPFNTAFKFGDDNYDHTYGLQLLAGKWLAPSDTFRQIIVNETFIRKTKLGTPQEALQKKVRFSDKFLPIVGVVKDFYTHSLHTAHQPLTMSTYQNSYEEVGVKMSSQNIQGSLAGIQKVFDEVYPEQVLNGQFMDERIQKFYEADQRMSALCKGFGFLAIFISCLGLLGLAMHAAARRTKEIGVRKVLGASIVNIVTLLSKDFILLVVVALFIAIPVAWYAMTQWLADFAYHVDLHWSIFLIGGLVAILVAFITVGFQGFRAAVADPIRALRDE